MKTEMGIGTQMMDMHIIFIFGSIFNLKNQMHMLIFKLI